MRLDLDGVQKTACPSRNNQDLNPWLASATIVFLVSFNMAVVNVMSVHYDILGSADMGCGLTAMGLTCGVVMIRSKLRLRCQGIEEV
jgi:hypothetical protein